MSFKSKLNLNAKIFNPDERKRAFSNLPMRAAREMRNSLRKKQLDSKPSGRIERYDDDRSRGRGFQRRFQRSRRGERPANETLTLNSAYAARRTSDTSALVEIEDRINPKNGESAREYAEKLQKMGRLVMTKEDVEEARISYNEDCQRAIKELLS